jgi:2-polyprenyl-3-methyl-5-hydroxy-6-metoxy-1,4-benzoquinol methylase
MKNDKLTAESLHEHVPENWYFESIKVDALQRFWHKKRFVEVSHVIDPVKGIVLDIGSNDGVFSKIILDKTGAEKIIGIDVVKKTVAWANTHWKNNGKMKFIVADAEKLPFPPKSFDAVFALEVLEHVFDPKKVLLGIKTVLKNDGYAVFLVPSDNLLFRIIWFFWLHFYPRGKVWRETHIQSYNGNHLTKISKAVGFKIVEDKKFMFGMLHLVKVKK